MSRVAIVAALIIAGCLCAAASQAETCQRPSVPDNFPEPATASDADIVAAQVYVKKYLADMEDSLKCLNASHNDSGYNQAVDDMRRTAASFNGLLRAYRARQQKT
jgi:hypothetical protein